MDYIRIYEAFIKDRRAKEPTLTGYTERHHVLPRSMGGDNDPGNLIDLTPEDHFFAHLLLAKAHGTRQMWGACMLMMGARRAGQGKFTIRRRLTRSRLQYGMIRRAYSAASQGEDGANADLTVRTFYHESGAVFVGTRIALSVHHGCPAASVNQMVQGVSLTCYGWALTPEACIPDAAARSERAKENGKKLRGFTRSPSLLCFYHFKTQTSMIANQKGMMKLGHLSRSSVSALCNGSRYLANGWCLIENAEWAEDRGNKRGEFAANHSSTIYKFLNAATGETFTGTIFAAGQAYNDGDSRPFGETVRGKRGGWRGWHLDGGKKPLIMGAVYKLESLISTNVVTGTIKEIAEKVGVTSVAVARVLNGTSVHTQGWCLDADKAKEALPRRTKLQLDRGFLPYPGRQGRGEKSAAA